MKRRSLVRILISSFPYCVDRSKKKKKKISKSARTINGIYLKLPSPLKKVSCNRKKKEEEEEERNKEIINK